MAWKRWIGTIDERDQTTRVILRGGSLVLVLGDPNRDSADLTDPELAFMLSRFILSDTSPGPAVPRWEPVWVDDDGDLARQSGSQFVDLDIDVGVTELSELSVSKHGAVGDWDGSTATDATAEIQATLDEAAALIAPARVTGRRGAYYEISETLQVPGGVLLDIGLVPADGFAGPMVEFAKFTGHGGSVFTSQAEGGGLNVRIVGRWPVPTALSPIADERTVVDGVWAHHCDHAFIGVEADSIAGTALRVGPVFRESEIALRTFYCASATKPACVFETSDAGDATNVIACHRFRTVYSQGVSVDFADTSTEFDKATRIVSFFSPHIEAGGYGGSSGTLQTSSASYPADLITFRSGDMISFYKGLINLAESVSGNRGMACLGNVDNYFGQIETFGTDILNSGAGTSVYLGKVGALRILGGKMFATKSLGGMNVEMTSDAGGMLLRPTTLATDVEGDIGVELHGNEVKVEGVVALNVYRGPVGGEFQAAYDLRSGHDVIAANNLVATGALGVGGDAGIAGILGVTGSIGTNGDVGVDGHVIAQGFVTAGEWVGIGTITVATAGAPNNSFFVSDVDGLLRFKDAAGIVRVVTLV